MFSVTHFRSEFIQQSQATIIRKVTMTQFMLVIVLTAIGVGLFNAPFWLAPLFFVAGSVGLGLILLAFSTDIGNQILTGFSIESLYTLCGLG